MKKNLEHLSLSEMRKARVNRRRERRLERQLKRIDARDAVKQAKMSKRFAKKMQKAYGDMSPEEVQALNEIQPVLPALNKELEAKGIEVNDPEDAVEVTAKYANANPQIEDVVEQEVIEGAYNFEDESFDDFDRAKAKSILGSVFTGAVAGIKDYTNKVKMKPVAERTPEEQRLLDAEKTANQYAVNAGKQSFLQEYGFFVILILVVVLWLKYK